MAARPKSHETELALFKQSLDNITSKLSSIEIQLETKYAQSTDLALVRVDIASVRNEISELRKTSVTQDQYWPVKVAVYGAIGLILSGAVGAILTLIYTKGA